MTRMFTDTAIDSSIVTPNVYHTSMPAYPNLTISRSNMLLLPEKRKPEGTSGGYSISSRNACKYRPSG